MTVLAVGMLVSAREARRALQAEAVAKERLAESQAVSKFMTGVFQSPDPTRNGRTITVAETLDRAATNLDHELAAQPEVCRTVEAERTSNEKKRGANNAKCGNRYLAWAFVEAANFARRPDPQCRKWYDRKATKTSNVIATKALACKLAKAAWHVMSAGTDYDPARMFGQPAIKK